MNVREAIDQARTAQNHIVTILRGGADGDPVVKFFDWRGEK